ncbi:MAG: hypothetical protein JWO19_1504 [Bryobacterales bacterium]|jgi:hypothetical protein|nr:hypothetical protein [Bryobacterales bacterium]
MEALSATELADLRRKLAAMKEHEVKSFYRSAHFRCELHEYRLPSARSVQELVQAWKQLRRWR